jgi:hypothetical protein
MGSETAEELQEARNGMHARCNQIESGAIAHTASSRARSGGVEQIFAP